MKLIKIILSIVISLVILTDTAFALKCNKCHRDEKSLDKFISDKAIKNKQDLFNLTRNGPKAKLHKNLTDEEIEEAAKFFNLR